MSIAVMNQLRHFRCGSGFAWLIVFLLAAPVSAETRLLLRDGKLASLESGPDASGLVLKVGDETVSLPSNLGAVAEPMLLTESTYSGLIAVWLSPVADRSRLDFASWDGEGWSKVHSLMAAGAPLELTQRPIVSVSQDRLRLALENSKGEATNLQLERIVLHVLWQSSDGRVRFSPIIFQEGEFVGWNEIVTLTSAFAETHSDAQATALPSSLAGMLAVRAHADQSLTVTLADVLYGRLGTLRIQTIPLAMELFGDLLLEEFLSSAELLDPDDPAPLADEIRGEIIHLGSSLDLDPNLTEFLSDRLARWLELNSAEFGWDLLALAEATRSQALDLGRSVYGVTLSNASGESIRLLDIGDFLDSGDGGENRQQLARRLRLSVTADFQAPSQVGDSPTVHASGDGSALAVSWNDAEGGVSWLENRGDGWTGVKSLRLSQSLDENAARQLIAASLD